MLCLTRIFTCVCLGVSVSSEIYTSSYQVKQLATGERELANIIQEYIVKEERRLKELKEFVHEVKRNLTKSVHSRNLKANDPISALQLIKRFESTWTGQITKLKDPGIVRETLIKVQRIVPEFPTSIDVDGASRSIIRLQRAYTLSPRQLQNISLAQASPSDCFQLAETAFQHGYPEIASDWLTQAVYLKDPRPNMAESRERIVKTLMAAAANRSKEPQCKRMHVTTSHAHNATTEPPGSHSSETKPRTRCTDSSTVLESEEEKFYKLCRGDISKHCCSRCTCHYKLSRLSYHRWKQEMLSEDPYIVIFHDVISDSEQQHLIKLSRRQLERAGVGRPDKGVTDEARTSKVAWLWDNHTDIVDRLSRRVAEITDLCTVFRDRGSCAEPLQVLNYGVGGEYHSHFDFYPNRDLLKKTAPFVQDSGDRLATFMFYLSDVPAGGATVFPEIGVQIPPIKGSAAFWYNYKEGHGDFRTKHGGCPVLQGEKWVANKWIHEVAKNLLPGDSL